MSSLLESKLLENRDIVCFLHLSSPCLEKPGPQEVLKKKVWNRYYTADALSHWGLTITPYKWVLLLSLWDRRKNKRLGEVKCNLVKVNLETSTKWQSWGTSSSLWFRTHARVTSFTLPLWKKWVFLFISHHSLLTYVEREILQRTSFKIKTPQTGHGWSTEGAAKRKATVRWVLWCVLLSHHVRE